MHDNGHMDGRSQVHIIDGDTALSLSWRSPIQVLTGLEII